MPFMHLSFLQRVSFGDPENFSGGGGGSDGYLSFSGGPGGGVLGIIYLNFCLLIL